MTTQLIKFTKEKQRFVMRLCNIYVRMTDVCR